MAKNEKRRKKQIAKQGTGRTWPDVAHTAITNCVNKGQLPLILVLAIVLVFTWRVPETNLGTVADLVVKHFVDFSLVGWLLAGGMTVWHVISSRKLRQLLHREVDRIAEERNQLQDAQAGNGSIQSSRKLITHSTSKPHKPPKERKSDGKHA